MQLAEVQTLFGSQRAGESKFRIWAFFAADRSIRPGQPGGRTISAGMTQRS
jgi:hypothetical protein